MSIADNILLTVGQNQKYQLSNSTPRYVIITNKSPYDVKISGFGVIGESWIVAGTESKLYNNNETGYISFLAVNTTNVSPQSQGALLITQYLPGDDEPKGTWPVSIPFQSVASTGVMASFTSLEPNYVRFVAGHTFALGAPETFNLTGANGIPVTATALLISFYGTAATADVYLQSYAYPASPPADPAGGVLFWLVQVAGKNMTNTCVVPLNAGGGFVVQAFGSSNVTGCTGAVLGYWT